MAFRYSFNWANDWMYYLKSNEDNRLEVFSLLSNWYIEGLMTHILCIEERKSNFPQLNVREAVVISHILCSLIVDVQMLFKTICHISLCYAFFLCRIL